MLIPSSVGSSLRSMKFSTQHARISCLFWLDERGVLWQLVFAGCPEQVKKKKKEEKKEEEEEEEVGVRERVFIINYEHISAVFLLRPLDYAMRNVDDKTNATDIERKWRIVTVAVLASKQ